PAHQRGEQRAPVPLQGHRGSRQRRASLHPRARGALLYAPDVPADPREPESRPAPADVSARTRRLRAGHGVSNSEGGSAPLPKPPPEQRIAPAKPALERGDSNSRGLRMAAESPRPSHAERAAVRR